MFEGCEEFDSLEDSKKDNVYVGKMNV